MAVEIYYSDKGMNQLISHMGGVHSELGDVARSRKRNAERRLAMHRYSGAAQVTISEGAVDWFVNLDDPAAMSIEFGHWVKGKYEDPLKQKFVPGLYILTLGAGLDTGAKQGPRRPSRKR